MKAGGAAVQEAAFESPLDGEDLRENRDRDFLGGFGAERQAYRTVQTCKRCLAMKRKHAKTAYVRPG